MLAFSTFNRNDELGNNGQDPLGSTLGQEILDAVDRQQHVRVTGLAETVEEQGQIKVVVQALDRHLAQDHGCAGETRNDMTLEILYSAVNLEGKANMPVLAMSKAT